MTKHLKLIGAAMAVVTILFSVQATPVTAEQAARAARSWIRGGRSLDRRLGREVESAEAVTAANGAAFHVAKVKDGGFVVMSADTAIEPVIAFSSSGELRNDPRNPLWTLLTGDLAARAKAKSAKLLSAATSSSAKSAVLTGPEARWAALLGESGDGQGQILLSASTGKETLSDVRVDALVKSAWSQEDYRNYGMMDESNYCYNYYTPKHWPCGCVATAGAQIMRYHCHPTGEVTPASYSCATGVLMKVDDDMYYKGVPVTLAMQGGFYDWNSMTLVPANGCTAAARRAIGKLTSDIGISCGMQYFPGGSSSPVYMLTKRFVDRFQYANAAGVTFSSGFYSKDFSYTLERFKSAVIPNFDAGLPVALGISGGGYGHAVVGDGYGYSDGNFYVHINLGWADMGGGNAWYMPPDIDEYDTIDSIVYNVYPQGAADASLVSGRVLTPSGAAVAGATVTATATGGAQVSATSDAGGFFALKVQSGTYGLSASRDGVSAQGASVTVGKCVSTTYNSDGTYSSATVPQIGNVYGQDFTLDVNVQDDPGPVPADPIEPGEWTTDVDGVLAAAKTNGNLIAVMYANLATCWYCQQLDPLAESAEFTSWAKEKGIYLVTADQSRYPYAAKALSWFYSYHTGMTEWPTIVFFNAWEPDVGIGEGLFRYGETVNGLTYQSTITSLKECFASFLSDRPVQPVQQSFFRFDGNGADSGSMADVVIDVSNDFPLNRFVRYGYSFLGWSNDPNDTEPLWADGEWPDVMLFDPGETVHTIYAVWEPELDYPEIFHFDGNGADSGEMQTFVANGEDFPLNSFVRHGYVFLGWALEASAKEPLWADGEMPEAWMFEPATNEHVLYAVWAVRKLSAVTASNAFIDGSVESPTYDKSGNITKGKVYTGEYISFYPDAAKGRFQSWTVKPATILDQLGEEIRLDSYLEFPMPAEAVTVTANMVAESKCGAFVIFDFVGSDTNAWSETAGAAWSPDKGKTWIPAEFSYPLAAGTYTIKFRAPEGWVAPGDLTLVVGKPKSFVDEYYDEELKKTVKETWYEPAWIERSALFYPVSETKLTTVKFDGNGGKPETAQVSYPTEYLVSGLRPLPSVQPRSGYAFDGWWTAKDGGEEIVEDASFDPMKLDPKTKALYAHWKKTYTVTLGGANMEAYAYEESDYWRYDSDWVQGKGAKLTAVGNGQFVDVSAPDDIVDAKSGKEFVFQKWTVSPSSAVLSGDGYDVQSSSVTFLMPESDLTLTPTYVDAEKCGRLCAYAWSQPICLGWDEEAQDYRYLEADYRDMQWSPDGGKTWYCCWDSALLPAGTYTVQWRSASPMWQAPTAKMKVEVVAGVDSDECCYDNFSFVPVVVIDVETSDGEAPEGCSVALNPKDGRVLPGKTLALTAKDSKTYIFQNWEIRQPGSGLAWYYAFEKSFKLYGTTKKSVDGLLVDALWDCIDPEDFKIHVTARFKSVKDYTLEDLLANFNGVYGPVSPQWEQVDDRTVEMTIYGMAGCSLDYMIEMGLEVNPITFKNASGKLPKGVKFDAKAGVISGVPTAKGVEKTTCVLTVTDPAKNVLNVKVNFEIRPFEAAGYAGEYNALLHPYTSYWDEEGAYIREEGKPIGLLQMSVTSAGKVSAKILHQGGSTSLSGNLTWYPDDGNAAAPGSFGIDLYDKSKGSLWGTFNEDGTMSFDWAASYKDGQDTLWLRGEGDTARRQDLDLYKDSPFANKYYTFSFGTSNTTYGVDCAVCDNEGAVEGGYGYLTVKTDAKGVAKIAGQLPDGTAVSGNAAVMPYESASGGIRARLYFFNAPSAYKKNGWCAMSLELVPEGDGVIIFSPDETSPAAWFEPDHYGRSNDWNIPTESGIGAFYSPAQTLENHYWAAVCAADDRVDYEFEYKEGRDSWMTVASPMTFDDTFFAVLLAGDKKGSVALAEKSPAPWNDRGEWNYREDKKGNPITDPSQLSISFAKATGVFSGKSNIYFDYYDGKKDQHQAVSVPYAGVMVNLSDVDPELGMMGLGAAVYSNKRTESDCSSGKTKKITYTQKVSLPVVLAPID